MARNFPTNPTVGQVYENYVWDGTAWQGIGSANNLGVQVAAIQALDVTQNGRLTSLETYNTALEAGWTAYTPTLYNATIGNGTVNFYYKKIGKTVFLKGRFSLGSTSSIGTLLDWSLPFAVAANTLGLPVWGVATFYNGGIFFGSNAYIGGGNVMRTIRYIVSGSNIVNSEISPTAPFTWTSGCHFDVEFNYECA